jgi:hypothetical protein
MVDKSMAHNDCGLSFPFEDAEDRSLSTAHRADPQSLAMSTLFCIYVAPYVARRPLYFVVVVACSKKKSNKIKRHACLLLQVCNNYYTNIWKWKAVRAEVLWAYY